MSDADRLPAVRDARHSTEYLFLAKHADARRKSAAIASAEHCAEAAFRWARRRYGYRDAIISADGLLVVLVAARDAGIARRGFAVTVEHEIGPHTLPFALVGKARKFMRDAEKLGARRAALAVDRDVAPTEQADLFAEHGRAILRHEAHHAP